MSSGTICWPPDVSILCRYIPSTRASLSMAGILSCILTRSWPPAPCEIDATAARAVGSIFALGRTVTRKVITLVSPAHSPLEPPNAAVLTCSTSFSQETTLPMSENKSRGLNIASQATAPLRRGFSSRAS